MSLKDILCQDKPISLLQRAYAHDKSSHAYIFAGLEGVGKFKTAIEWAKLLLCEDPVAGKKESLHFTDSCGACGSCRLFDAGSHPDFNHVYKELREFTKDGKGKAPPVELPIDVIREFLIEKVATRPTVSERKVFVVSEAEKLNVSSQNCVLKVLEEPPEYCCIILLCTRLERLLPTTKSRCQTIRFGPIDLERITERLREMGTDLKKARYFARLSGGSLGLACQWAELELADAGLYALKRNLVGSIANSELPDALELAQQSLDDSKRLAAAWSNLDKSTSRADLNRRAQKTLIQMVISVLHDVMTLDVMPAEILFNFDQQEQVKKLANRLEAEQAAEKIADCYEMLRWIESGVNEKLIFEQLLLSLSVSDTMTPKQ
ncbi:MAG: DNA polymerase III subunit delta' [Phycisphaerales bacterium]|nr:MAG: DNA polymerase III subunit delta' [Phycisphaerales bacterium]